jgi:hypothetical protein
MPRGYYDLLSAAVQQAGRASEADRERIYVTARRALAQWIDRLPPTASRTGSEQRSNLDAAIVRVELEASNRLAIDNLLATGEPS